jgi:hypothetical protein
MRSEVRLVVIANALPGDDGSETSLHAQLRRANADTGAPILVVNVRSEHAQRKLFDGQLVDMLRRTATNPATVPTGEYQRLLVSHYEPLLRAEPPQ